MKRNEIPDIKEKIYFQNYENFFNVYSDEDNDYYYNISKKVNIPEDIGSNYYLDYIVKPGDTWTLISYTYYNDVKLWWAICIANNIQNPLELPTHGTRLKILVPEVVQNILATIRSS